MLPAGHASVGYLVALGVVSLLRVPISDPLAQTLLLAGFVFGAIPDLDMFVAFFKTRSLVIENEKKSHRTYITHTPIFWTGASGITALITRDPALSLIVLLAPLSHLFLDTIEDEIRWLWPISKQSFRLITPKENLVLPKEPFFSYWRHFVVWYVKNRKITATLEAVMVLLFIIVLLGGLRG
ncbi:MAG: metal-dependent hydrolase [Candidatus Uhrbacteria bacterium]|nr:metal-dependent hydrolase [Candidatus Uhrbacteria bacterium]